MQKPLHVVIPISLLFISRLLSSQVPDSLKIVNTGYGEQEARSATGAVFHLDAEKFNRGQVYEWNQLWQGLAPGFTTVRAGSNPNEWYDTRIRGLHTINGPAQPLYVVDGVPGVDLLAVDPADIAAVDVLRDAASTAMYGGRGASGVVLISTRKKNTPGVTAAYRGQLVFESAADRYEVLNEAAYVGFGGTDLSPGSVVNTDWQDQVLRQGISQTHHLGLSGSNSRGGFLRVSMNYRNLEGILRGSGFQQYNGNLLLSQKIWKDKITLSGGLSLASRESELGFPEAYRYAVVSNPSATVRSDDPAYAPYGGYVEKSLFDYFNPVAIIELNKNERSTVYGLGHLRAEIQLLPGLTASMLLAKEQNRGQTSEYYSKQSHFRGIGRNGVGRNAYNNANQDILESTVQWRFGVSHLRAQLLGGYGWQQSDQDGYEIEAGNIISNVLENNNFESFTDIQKGLLSISGYKQRTRLIGYFGRAQLRWNDTYFLTFGARRDGASQLGKNAKWGSFPFASAGVDVAKLLNLRAFDYLKIRAGKGTSGSVPSRDHLSAQLFGASTKFYYNGNYIPSYGIAQNANPDLGWERTGEFSFGLDFSLPNNRLDGSLDFYQYTSADLIIQNYVPVPPNFAQSTYENKAELSGKGMEITLNYEAVKQQDLRWEIGLVASKSSATLETLGRTDTTFAGTPGAPCACGTYYYLLYPGAPVGTFWGPVATGELDGNGQFVYQNIDKNPQIDVNSYNRDQTNLGSGLPKWVFGIRQTLTWKRFDLNVLLRGASGHMLVHEMRLFYESVDPSFITWNKVVTSYFDEKNKNIARFDNVDLEKGSFLRIQYASLGYRFRLSEKSGFRDLQLQVGAQNLLTFTKYTGLDPEVRLSDFGPTDNGGRGYGVRQTLDPGIDRRSTYPLARSWWVGVQATF